MPSAKGLSFGDYMKASKEAQDFWPKTIAANGNKPFSVRGTTSEGKSYLAMTVTPSARQGVDYQLTRFDHQSQPMSHLDIHGKLTDAANIKTLTRELPRSSGEAKFEMESGGGSSSSRRSKSLKGKATAGSRGR
ncbi:hypothetical protein L248_2140 [Schleiferilactobacillus shenzhenensis LY-73]|uniref:Uncharacterized protein n=2 Tax=Schleiferilactobacillus shenzhenensis TaxID=1231337 RepID=U4TQT0_9LACO|nr:hypothetical protein L248_2140 [Schleiferilactobacillus shenzhenensis LY-73]